METLIDKLLVEQSNLQTPVAQFSKIHDNHELRTDLYKHLIPLEKPAKGEQYTFQVELDKCTGCKACLVACHTLNGLDEDEAWRDVGLLEGGDDAPGFQQTVTTACHHCLEILNSEIAALHADIQELRMAINSGEIKGDNGAQRLAALEKELRSHIESSEKMNRNADKRGLILAGADRVMREMTAIFKDDPQFSEPIENAINAVWAKLSSELSSG